MDFLTQYSAYAVCLITAVFGYAVGRWHQLFLEQRNMLNLRFQKLYAPFEKEYLKCGPGAFAFSDLSETLKTLFLNLLIDNYELTDSSLKKLIYEFRCSLASNDAAEINRIFFEIAVSIDSSFNRISKKLFMEPHKF